MFLETALIIASFVENRSEYLAQQYYCGAVVFFENLPQSPDRLLTLELKSDLNGNGPEDTGQAITANKAQSLRRGNVIFEYL